MTRRFFGVTVGLAALFAAVQIQAAELHGHNFDDKMNVGGKELVLNGLGLRTVTRFGIPNIKVYVMGLYVPAKSNNGEEILKNVDGPKVFKMSFHRAVDAEAIREQWTMSYNKNCGTVCDANKPQLKSLNNAMSDVRTNQTITITTHKDKVDVDTQGRKSVQVSIDGADFARIVEKMFIGATAPVDPNLKAGLLGSPAK